MKIISRAATNSYRVINLIDNSISLLPGDLLVKVSELTEDEFVALSNEMSRRWAESCAIVDGPTTRQKSRNVSAARLFVDESIRSKSNACDGISVRELYE